MLCCMLVYVLSYDMYGVRVPTVCSKLLLCCCSLLFVSRVVSVKDLKMMFLSLSTRVAVLFRGSNNE